MVLSKTLAFAFDIDGVLLRGKQVLPGASKALKLLNQNKIPWIVLTNGGGTSELDRVTELSEKLQVQVKVDQFLQSHTPYKDIAKDFSRIYALGGKQDTVRETALGYGFKDVLTSKQLVANYPMIHPFPNYTSTIVGHERMYGNKYIEEGAKFDGIFMFHDSWDFSVDAQLVIDLLLSKNGELGTRISNDEFGPKPSIPIFFSNADLEWATDYKVSRLGQGSFIATIRALYKSVTGHDLQDTVIGKPTALTYNYAEKILNHEARRKGINKVDKVFMIGDNQNSDIMGANGKGWESVLLRTGVYKNGDKMFTKPTYIEDNVLSAVERVLRTVD